MVRVLVVCLAVLAWTLSVHAAAEAEFSVGLQCGWDGYYRPMEWTPAEIDISATLTEPFAGSLTLTVRQDSLNTLNVVHNIVLTPGRALPLPLVAKLAFDATQCTVTLRDNRGRTRWQQTWSVWDYVDAKPLLRAVRDEDLLIGVMGRPQFGLLQLPEEAVCTSSREPGVVRMGVKTPRMMPWDWTGFAGLDLLVLYDPDWTLLNPQQSKAICDWVMNGGTLLVVLGRHPLPPGGDLSRLIPVAVGDLRTCDIPSTVLGQWGLEAGQSQSVTAWSLSAKPGAQLLRKTQAPGDGCLSATAYVGFGRVAVLAFDPSELGDPKDGRGAKFWVNEISACLNSRPAAPAGSARSAPEENKPLSGYTRTIVLRKQVPGADNQQNANANIYRMSIAQSASNGVMGYLYDIPQMRPPSFWWIVLTLSALAVLLGPVDYWVLKRLDKLPWTWLTATAWIGLFTLGTYYGVQHLRGSTMQIRAVSVLDGVADSNGAWATCYVGLFAPRSDEYRLDGLRRDQWWAGVAPIVRVTSTAGGGAAIQQLQCLQQDGANLPAAVPISIWTMQSLLGECPLDRMPFTATVTAGHDPNAATVEIANRSDSRIVKGFVLWADGYASLGEVPARASQVCRVPRHRFSPWSDDASSDEASNESFGAYYGQRTPRYPDVLSEPARSAFLAQGCLNRSLMMHRCLSLGAALVCVEFDNAAPPVAVKDHSYQTSHVQYARQLVPAGESNEGRIHD